MATADQIKSLVKAHLDGNNEKFRTTVLQIAAYEAKQNHVNFARELKKLVETQKVLRPNVISLNKVNPMLQVTLPDNCIDDLIVSNEIRERIIRILTEYKNKNKLQQFGLENRRKILIEGPPGTGKTFTASVIAAELSLPLYTVQVDKLITKFMGETSVKLRQIFESIEINIGVYFFDEFDAIGAERGRDNEVGEMRRVLNSFLQFIEQDSSESIIFGATNNIKILDSALFRRFDDIITYSLPNKEEIEQLIKLKLHKFLGDFSLKTTVEAAIKLSHAEITNACNDALKEIILTDKNTVTQKLLVQMMKDRKNSYNL